MGVKLIVKVLKGSGEYMTENKRFTLEWESEEICQVADNGNYMGTDEVVDLLNELVTKCNTLTDEKSKCECQLKRRTRQRDELADFNVELMEKNKELKEINQDHQDHILLLEEEKINLQIKLQKIRDYAMENGEVKQDVIEKVVFE